MKRCYSYSRVSSEQQVENYSIETQQESMRQYAKENDIEIVKEFIEAGVTGAILNRPALNELRDYISQEKPDVVLFFDPDRLSRDFINQVILKNEFDKLGIEVAFYKGGFVGKTPQEKLLFNMRGIISEYELSQLKERTIRGRRQRLKSGMFWGGNSAKLYGYQYKDGQRHIDPEQSKVVRDIFKWYLEGNTMLGITYRFYTLGVKSPSGQERWNNVTIYKVLSNRAYAGTAICAGVEISQPQLVSVKDFETVQARLRRNKELAKRNAKLKYLLSGFLFCNYCHRRYTGSVHHGTRYYNCPNGSYKIRVNPCKGKSVRADSLEAVIWLEIEKALTSPELLLAGLEAINEEDYTPELEVIKTKLAHFSKEKRRCWRAYEVTGDLETFKEEIKEIDAQRNALEKRHREIEGLVEASEQRPNPSDIKTACDTIYNNLGNLQYEDRRLALEALKVKIYAGEPVRIEGALPIELTPSRRGER